MRCGWKKFRDLSGILTSKKVTLRLKGKVYGACVRSAIIYGSETWAVDSGGSRGGAGGALVPSILTGAPPWAPPCYKILGLNQIKSKPHSTVY